MNKDLNKTLLEFIEGDTSEEEFQKVYQQAVQGDYESFVTKLKSWAGDPKVTEFLKSGMSDGSKGEDKFTVSSGVIACSQLKPTQNEIDLNKSLNYPLKDANLIKRYLEGKNIVIGAPIIIFNSRYIIDGHHRWSQIFCINPEAKIQVLNFHKSGLGPEDMLKAMQIAILSNTGNIPTALVEGNNLLKISPQEIMKFVINNISDEAAKVLGKTKESAGKKIALNCKQMQTNNQPIKGAPARGFMPQTDDIVPALTKSLTSGQVQIEKPFIKTSNIEESRMKNKKVLKEWDPSMSTDKSAPFNQGDWDGLHEKIINLAIKSGMNYDSIPNFTDIEYEKWINLVDRDGYIYSKYEDKVQLPGHKFKSDDMEGYEEEIANLIFPLVKNEIKKKSKLFSESKMLSEYYSATQEIRDELFTKIVNKLQASGLKEVDDNSVYDFIDYNYDLIKGVIDTIEPKFLLKNYSRFVNKPQTEPTMNESLNNFLKEDDSVEQADPIAMFQDFSDISGSLADIYSTLVSYQTSYITNPKVQSAIGQIMQGVNQLMKQSTATMQILGGSFGLKESKK